MCRLVDCWKLREVNTADRSGFKQVLEHSFQPSLKGSTDLNLWYTFPHLLSQDLLARPGGVGAGRF